MDPRRVLRSWNISLLTLDEHDFAISLRAFKIPDHAFYDGILHLVRFHMLYDFELAIGFIDSVRLFIRIRSDDLVLVMRTGESITLVAFITRIYTALENLHAEHLGSHVSWRIASPSSDQSLMRHIEKTADLPIWIAILEEAENTVMVDSLHSR